MKKIFLGLVFSVISMLGSDVFAMDHHVAPGVALVVTGVHVFGPTTTITYSNNERIEFNNNTTVIRYFRANGIEVVPVPGLVVNAALAVIANNAHVAHGINILQLPRIVGAAIAGIVSAMIASGLYLKIDSLFHLSNLDPERLLLHCCQTGWQHDFLRRGIPCCAINRVVDWIPQILPLVCVVVVFIIVFNKIRN